MAHIQGVGVDPCTSFVVGRRSGGRLRSERLAKLKQGARNLGGEPRDRVGMGCDPCERAAGIGSTQSHRSAAHAAPKPHSTTSMSRALTLDPRRRCSATSPTPTSCRCTTCPTSGGCRCSWRSRWGGAGGARLPVHVGGQWGVTAERQSELNRKRSVSRAYRLGGQEDGRAERDTGARRAQSDAQSGAFAACVSGVLAVPEGL